MISGTNLHFSELKLANVWEKEGYWTDLVTAFNTLKPRKSDGKEHIAASSTPVWVSQKWILLSAVH